MTSGWMLAPNVLAAFQRLLGADVVLEAWVTYSPDADVELNLEGGTTVGLTGGTFRLKLANGRTVELELTDDAYLTLIGGNDG